MANYTLNYNSTTGDVLVQSKGDKKVSGYTQVDTFTFTPMTQGKYGLEGKDGALYTVVFGVVEENKASLGMPDIVNMQKVTLNQDTNYIPLTAISISPASATLAAKGTQASTVTFDPVNASNDVVNFASNNKAVATVHTTTGLITGVATGKATITGTSEDGSFTDTVVITVS